MPNKGLTWKAVSCGCEIDSAGMGIVWCPLHAAAEEMRLGLANILEWAESRDGSPEADDLALRTIAKDARALLAKVDKG